MNTALIAPEPLSARPIRSSTVTERFLRRAELALAWRRRPVERRSTREELAQLHERRQEATRLREETFRNVVFARML